MQGGAVLTLSWGRRPPVDSAPVGEETGQRDAGRSNRGCVVRRARLKPDADSRPMKLWVCCLFGQALASASWFGWSPLRWARSPRVGSRVRRGEYESIGRQGQQGQSTSVRPTRAVLRKKKSASVSFTFSFARDDDDEYIARPLARPLALVAAAWRGREPVPLDSSASAATLRTRPCISQRRACTTRVDQAACIQREQAKMHAQAARSEGGGGQRARRDPGPHGNATYARR